MATLPPEQIKQNQELVKQQVEKQAVEQGLSQEEAIALLKQTLEHNSLPMIEGLVASSPSSSSQTQTKVGPKMTSFFTAMF